MQNPRYTSSSAILDYYPGGMMQPGRQYTANSTAGYRFGFNGQEKDNEVYGNGNLMTAEYWEYDSRILKRWNIDPVVKQSESPYLCFSGNPILLNDQQGNDDANPLKAKDVNKSSVAFSDKIKRSDFRIVDDYVFNEKGYYVRTDKNDKPDRLVIEDSKTKKQTAYAFHDPKTDVAAINWNINKFGSTFKNIRFIYKINDLKIEQMMKTNDIHYRSFYSRTLFVMSQSTGGKMDFASTTLADELVQNEHPWSAEDVLTHDRGPIFIFGNDKTAYNYMDAGNWLWGNAVNRIGGSFGNATGWSLANDPNDTEADQEAILNGWFYQDGCRDTNDCPINK